MFCEKCGTKNLKNAKFCEKCGNQIRKDNNGTKEFNNLKSKIKNLSKKTKIIMTTVALIAIVSIIVLGVLLNNPVKKVNDYLTKYYTNYERERIEELSEIGKILKNNKKEQKVLNNIKEDVHGLTNGWVKNFNKEYQDTKDLDTNYQKVSNVIKSIYDYYNGLEYMIDYDLYKNYSEELKTLYNSKYAFLEAVAYENKKDAYNAYYYYQKVAISDCYYKKAEEYINNYVKDEVDKVKKEAEKLITTNESSSNEEILNCYLNQIKYLNEHKTVNNINISDTKDYQELYENATKMILEYTKKQVDALNKKDDYNASLKLIESIINNFNSDTEEYKELSKLKENCENKLPDSLLSKYTVSNTLGSSYSNYKKIINDKEYNNYLSFRFRGETESRVYRLNNEYKKFKTTIVRGEDWDKSFSGYFVIYGDDKELYKSKEITKSSELDAQIELDVTNVDDLKIEFVTKSKPSGWDSFYIYLVEPYLYK